METGMISLGRMEAHMMRRHSHTGHQCAAYSRTAFSIDSAHSSREENKWN